MSMRWVAAQVALVVLAAGLAVAAAQPVATLTKATGLVRVIPAGSPTAEAAKSGRTLMAEDTVATADGRAEITFAEGHVVRLNTRTTLKIAPPPDAATQKRGISRLFAMLMGGSLKAIVKPVKPGDAFSIGSVQAIASVKGTEFFFDGGLVQVRDEKDAQRHEVLVSDLKTARDELVGEGQEGGFRSDGSAVDPHAIGDEIFQKLDEQFEAEQHAADAGAGAAAAAAAATAGAAHESTVDALRSEMHEELSEFSHADDIGVWADVQERRTDTELGKVLHDRHGDWVRMDENIVQTASNEVSLIVINERQTGPNRGTSMMSDVVDFNADLPSDQFADIYRTYPNYLWDTSTYPPYFRTAETVTYQNPFGDHIRQEYTFGDPVLLYDSYTKSYHSPANDVAVALYADSRWEYVPDTQFGVATNWGQAVDYKLYAGTAATDVLKERFVYSEYGDLNGGWVAGVNALVAGEYYDSYIASGISYVNHNLQPLGHVPTLWAYTILENPNATFLPYDEDRNDANTFVNLGMPVLNQSSSFASRTTDFGVDIANQVVLGWVDHYWDNLGIVEAHYYPDGSWLAERYGLIDDQGNELDPYGWYDKFNYELEWASSDFSTDPDTGVLRSVDLVLDPDIFNSLHDSNTTTTSTTNPTPQ